MTVELVLDLCTFFTILIYRKRYLFDGLGSLVSYDVFVSLFSEVITPNHHIYNVKDYFSVFVRI